MDITLQALEEMRLTNTEERIIEFLSRNPSDKSTIREISEQIGVLHATYCKELKKLVLKDVVIVNNSEVYLSDFGKKLCNYNNFKKQVLETFCNSNKIDVNTYNIFIKNRNFSNMKLLLGIKNLLNK